MQHFEDGSDEQPVSTGIEGLDDILRGGFTPRRLYLVEGDPGSGKTTLALQFLLEGAARGESTLYVTLSETKQELVAVARSHGWLLEQIHIHEMPAYEASLSPEAQLTMFHPSELELTETTKAVLEQVDQKKPRRIVFDSLSEMRLLAQNALRYRRQILALKQYFAGRQSTVLLLDDRTGPGEDLQLQSIAHGVVRLEHSSTGYGAERRRLTVCKMRGVAFRGGVHDFVIRRGGLDVFPRLVASEHGNSIPNDALASDNEALDALLGGGLPSGSSTLLIGPAGVGKSATAIQFAVAAARRGERSSVFIFDETVHTMQCRSRSLGVPLDEYVEAGLITVQQVDPAELSPGEFGAIVRRAVGGGSGDPDSAKVVVIDSLNGYLHSMPEERFLSAQLHELFTYLNQLGVKTLVTLAQSGLMGTSMLSPVDTTYLADNVILFRYFEAHGQIRRAISVVKKRSGRHERSIRELRMDSRGLQVGEPLENFQGILTGTPTFLGAVRDLIGDRDGQVAAQGEHNAV